MTQVTEADREAAWPLRPSCYNDNRQTREKWNDGVYDTSAPSIKIVARHRERAVQEAVAERDARIEALEAKLAEAAGKLEKAELWFDHYAKLHSDKKSPDGDQKAVVNLARAMEMGEAAQEAYAALQENDNAQSHS